MPPSRAQRRQQNARSATRANPHTTKVLNNQQDDIDQAALEAAEAQVAAEPIGTLVDMSPRTSSRVSRPARRPINRPVPAPVDYTADYVVARSDLTKIAIWAVILFAAMFAIRFSGLI
jgi:hypothetical protein